MSLDQLPVNVFDFTLAAVLLGGLFRGRKHGMSEELMLLIKWLLIIGTAGALYQPLGRMLAESSPFSLLTSYLMVYLIIALAILGLFALVKHSLGGKLIGSDVFGRAEYYLGMGSGLVRFGCMVLAVLALLNARYFSPAEVRAMERYQNDLYGSNFFPGLQTAQSTVFERSATGPWIRENLAFLLIEPTPPQDKQFHQKDYKLPE
jgi:uncharacterized membrane protein required for colicin V production